MGSIERRLEFLDAARPETLVRILTDALAHAEPDERGALAAALAATGRSDAVAVIIRHLHRLGPEGRRSLRAARPAWSEAFRRVLSTDRRLPVLNALSVLRTEGEPAHAPLIAGRLLSGDPAVATAAARSLLAVTRREVGPHGRRHVTLARHAALDTALGLAGRTYREHRLEHALLAIALCADRPGPKLARLLDDPEQPVTLALLRLPAREEPALVRENLIDWLASPLLERAAARALARPHAPPALSDILGRGHLLLVPARRRALRRLDRPANCLPAVPASVGLSPSAQARLPRYIDATGLAPDVAIRKLGQCRRLSNTTARALALHRLFALGDPAGEEIGAFVHDAEPRLAHAAALRLARAPGGLPAPIAARLESSPHAAVARIGRRSVAETDVAAFFERWGELTESDRVAAARRLHRADAEEFSAALLAIVVGPDSAARLPALLLARRLGLTAPAPAEVLVEIKSGDPRFAATVMATLADAPPDCADPELRRGLIRFGLHHSDARVRANAVEVARGREIDGEWSTLRGLAGDAENRPRANAITALYRRRPEIGLPLLETMLRDPNPLHRVSALWAARSARATSAVGLLQWMARQDRVNVIRRRAARAVAVMTDPDQVPAGEGRR